MLITYDISCFERELKIIFPDGYESYKHEIVDILNEAYDEWHSPEKIEDLEERAYVEDSCCEEYLMEKLSLVFNQWVEWTSEYYGNNLDELSEDETCWTKNIKEV